MDTTPSLLQAIPAIGMVLVTWLLWGAIFIALGLAVLRLAGDRAVSADRLIAAFWSGIAVTVGILQVWSLFGPVALGAAIVVAALGLAAFAWACGAMARWVCTIVFPRAIVPTLLLGGITLWMGDRALALPGGTDSGLYHLQAVRWAHTFAATPGLANLHDRLGFNNANHLLVAMMGSGPWENQGGHIAPGLFVLGLFAAGLLALARVWRREPVRARDVFDPFLLPAAFLMAVGGDVSSPSSDLPAAAVTLAAASALFAFLQTPGDVSGEQDATAMGRRGADVIAITLLLTLGACFKLSAAVFSVAAWLVMGIAWVRASRRAVDRGDRGHRPWGRLAATIGVAGMLAVPWCIRSVVLSGYPFYPSSTVAIDVPWKAPVDRVDYARLSVISWARQPGRTVAPSRDWRWINDRWREFTFANPMSVLYPMEFAVVAGVAAIILPRRKTKGRIKVSGTIIRQHPKTVPDTFFPAGAWLLLAWAAAIVAWFFSAPALRFAWHLFFIPPAIAAALLLRALTLRGWIRTVRWGLGLVCLALIIRVYDPLFFRPLLVTPGIAHGFEPTPAATLSVFVTRSGLRIYHASDGDCWDAPLPCSPELSPDLRLRREGDLGSGFILGAQPDHLPHQATPGPR